MDLAQAAKAIIFILPSYFANSIPVLLGGGKPIDGGKKADDGERILGDGKTIRGFFAGIFAALAVGALQAIALPGSPYDIYHGEKSAYILAGILLGIGTMVGDLAGSYMKRRLKIAQGKPSFLMDQLLFLIGALTFSYPLAYEMITIENAAFLAVLTYFVHVAANVLAHRLGLKKVPW